MCRRGTAAAHGGAGLTDLLLYVVFPAAALLLFLLRKLPAGPVLHRQRWPSIVSLGLQILWSAITKRSKAVLDGQNIPSIEVALTIPTAFDTSRLAKFRSLVGHSSLPGQEVPVMYPIVESFRLCIQAMLLPQFPLHVLGSVLARNRTEVYLQLRPQDELVYSCQVGTQLRVTVKGDTEADLISSATRKSDGQLVWRSTLTVIVLGKHRNKHAAGPPAASAAPSAGEREQVDTWRLSGAVGRRYGLLNGDLNPIHIHPLTSRLFGFRRPIAHALFLVGKAEASLRNAGLIKAGEYPTVMETEFKRPTLLPAKLVVEHRKEPKDDGALHFAIVTSDSPPKDVIVGKVLQGPGAAASALSS